MLRHKKRLVYQFVFFFAVVQSVQITQNHEDITVNLGDTVSLLCSAEVEARSCLFVTPEGETLTILPGIK